MKKIIGFFLIIIIFFTIGCSNNNQSSNSSLISSVITSNNIEENSTSLEQSTVSTSNFSSNDSLISSDSQNDLFITIIFHNENNQVIGKDQILNENEIDYPIIPSKIGYEGHWEEINFNQVLPGEEIIIKYYYTVKTFYANIFINKEFSEQVSYTIENPLNFEKYQQNGYEIIIDDYTLFEDEITNIYISYQNKQDENYIAYFYLDGVFISQDEFNPNDLNSLTYPEIQLEEGYEIIWDQIDFTNNPIVINGYKNPINYLTKIFIDGKESGSLSYNIDTLDVAYNYLNNFNPSDPYLEIQWEEFSFNDFPKEIYGYTKEKVFYIYFLDENGDIVDIQNFTKTNKNFQLPEIPKKEGYVGYWESFNLENPNDIYVNLYYEKLQYFSIYVDNQLIDKQIINYDDLTNLTYEEFTFKYLYSIDLSSYYKQYYNFNFIEENYYYSYENAKLNKSDITIDYFYTPISYQLIFIIEEFNSSTNIISTYEEIIYYNIENYNNLTIPEPGKYDYHETTWSEYELFSDLTLRIDPIHTPIEYTNNFYIKNNPQIDEYQLLTSITYNCNNYQNIQVPLANNNQYYNGSWQEDIFIMKDQDIFCIYTPINYQVSFYVINDYNYIENKNYSEYKTIQYNIENVNNFKLPEPNKLSYYNSYWSESFAEIFNFTNQIIYCNYEPIIYTYEYYLDDSLYDSYNFTYLEYKKMSGLTLMDRPILEGYYTEWIYNYKVVSRFEDIGCNNAKIVTRKTLIDYFITYYNEDNSVYRTINYTVLNRPSEYIPFIEKDGYVGKWGLYVDNSLNIIDLDFSVLDNYFVYPYYTDEDASEGLIFEANSSYSCEVIGYQGLDNNLVIPYMYHGKIVFGIRQNALNGLEINSLEIRCLDLKENILNGIINLQILKIPFALYSKSIDSVENLSKLKSDDLSTLQTIELIDTTPIQSAPIRRTLIIDINSINNLIVSTKDFFKYFLNTDYLKNSIETIKFNVNYQEEILSLSNYTNLKYIEVPNINVWLDNTYQLPSFTQLLVKDFDFTDTYIIPNYINHIYNNAFINTPIKNISFEEGCTTNFDSLAFAGIENLTLNLNNGNTQIAYLNLDNVKILDLRGGSYKDIKASEYMPDGIKIIYDNIEDIICINSDEYQLLESSKIRFYVNDTSILDLDYIIVPSYIDQINISLKVLKCVIYNGEIIQSDTNFISLKNNNNLLYTNEAIYEIDFQQNFASLVYYYQSNNTKSFEIPNMVAYKNNNYIVKKVGENAFSFNNELENLHLNSNLTHYLAKPVENIKNVYIPSLDFWYQLNFNFFALHYQTPINNGANLYVNGELLTELIVSPNDNLKSGLFTGCLSLERLVLENGIESIGIYTFSNCPNLKDIYIPSTLKGIQEFAFSDQIKNVYFEDFNKYLQNFELIPILTDKEEWVFPFGSSCNFYDKGNLITSYQVPNSITKINAYAFKGCTSIQEITIDKTLVSIYKNAFSYCNNLKTVIYLGTLDEWNQIYFENENSNPLNFATSFYVKDENGQLIKIK